jgi:hypothetical protein
MFMTKRLFNLWGKEVFFPIVEKRRRFHGYDGKVLLLMAAFGSHHTDDVMRQCKERNIDVLFLVPRAPDQTQPLDLLTFALMKH